MEQGLKLSRQAMSTWVPRAAEEHLLPAYEDLHRQLAKREVLQIPAPEPLRLVLGYFDAFSEEVQCRGRPPSRPACQECRYSTSYSVYY